MDLEIIKVKVKEHIEQSKEGLSKEDVKFDFKAKWHDLSNKPGINEFLKDTSAIANTFGPDGFLVYGFDDKTNQFTEAKFSDSGLRDSNELHGVLVKGMGEVFDLNHYDIEIDGNYLSVLHIPPALNKPYVIKNYQTFDKVGNLKREEQQRIFVRKNTSTGLATKYDIELMYYDRKNIIPDYLTQASILKFTYIKSPVNHFTYLITLENIGRRPMYITKIEINYITWGGDYSLLSTDLHESPRKGVNSHAILRQNDIIQVEGTANFNKPFRVDLAPEPGENIQVNLILDNGKIVSNSIIFPEL